ncbi:MAG: hypothetical protein ACLF0P_15110 [Thermoanaerobaculia bacterium]
MTVLYVDPEGRVHSGRLEAEGESSLLTTRSGRSLEPREVAAIVAPRTPTNSERTAFHRAAAAGYRVERR